MSIIKLETVREDGEFRESLKDTDWAWLSGMLDGEGHLAIRKGYTQNTHKHHSWSKDEWVWYTPRVGVSNTHLGSMIKVANMLEHNIQKRPAINEHKHVYYVETCSRSKIKSLLPLLIPFMVIKKKIAEIIYQLVCLPRGSGQQKELLHQKYLSCR